VGAEPLAVTDNLNFGSPEKPVGYWQLANACRGIAEACRELGTPVTGGNVSLYNETVDADGNPQPIYPTPVVGMVGLIPDITRVCSQAWQAEGDLIYLLGRRLDSPEGVTLGASEYLSAIHGIVAGKPPIVDFDLERRVQAACREGIRQGWIRSAHDCAEGGVAIALSEACITSNLGAEIHLGLSPETSVRWDSTLFGEGGARILVSVVQEHQAIWESYLKEQLENCWEKVGRVGKPDSELRVFTTQSQTLIDVSIKKMGDAYHHAIQRRLIV
jgi:phosphoribosylformylglycinamidine synthase